MNRFAANRSKPLIKRHFFAANMEKFSKYNFSGINIKKNVASRFRDFSKQISRSHTEALEAMLNFFDWNDLSPDDNLGVKNDGTKKRINAVIAILKNIEKHQTKPTAAILRSLLEETSAIEKEEEEFSFETPQMITENEELTYYRNAYFSIQENYNGLKNDLEAIIQKTAYAKSSFGSGHYKLNMTKDEFKELKQKIQDVHHDNQTDHRR